MATVAAKLGACVVQSASANITNKLESFWKDQTCVITFLRRFGCKFCRLEARNLSLLKPALDSRQIKLIAISFDSDGLKEFIDGNYFDGEVHVDAERKTYQAMDFKRVSIFSGMLSLMNKSGRSLNSEADEAKVSGNLKGDGWQTGGLVVVEKGGKILYEFRQDKVVDHPDYAKIMQVLGINPKELPKLPAAVSASCDSDACTR